ncbi:MAG: hypothetical protein WD509_01995 [Candidatus Paceibacterota bacterium]
MKLNITKAKDFVLVWENGQIDLYLKPSGNFDIAYHDLKDEDIRIVKGMWNHLNSKKSNFEYAEVKNGIEEVIKALDKIIEDRKE